MLRWEQEQLLSSGKAVTTPEEVALLVQIYLATGHADEAVEMLQGPTLNADSRVGGQDPQLNLSLLLRALGESKLLDKTVDVCHTLLEKPEHREDDRVWQLLLRVHKHGEDPM